MTTLTLQIPNKYKSIVTQNEQLEKITSYFINDYLSELYQDSKTKKELENNPYDKILNSRLKSAI
ncbi:TPA: hypothetical protein DEG21_04735 [Patescibacteria group bacterium]|nr:hypothetical protein [Candidatus Gracilibacteria bacterium]HBY75139.1 hypothetical protein [Candidatus Gracilibacteria bacterium]